MAVVYLCIKMIQIILVLGLTISLKIAIVFGWLFVNRPPFKLSRAQPPEVALDKLRHRV